MTKKKHTRTSQTNTSNENEVIITITFQDFCPLFSSKHVFEGQQARPREARKLLLGLVYIRYTTYKNIHPTSPLQTGGGAAVKANSLSELKEFILSCLYQTAPLCC